MSPFCLGARTVNSESTLSVRSRLPPHSLKWFLSWKCLHSAPCWARWMWQEDSVPGNLLSWNDPLKRPCACVVLSCWPTVSLRHLGGLLQDFIQLLTGQNNTAVLGSCLTVSGSISLNIAHHGSNTPTMAKEAATPCSASFPPDHSPVHGAGAGGKN